MTGELGNVFQTHQAIGNKEDLSDFITNISPEETPAYDRFGTVSAAATKHEWQIDALGAATANAQVEGKTFSASAVTPTVRLTNSAQTFTKEFTVSDIQEVVSKAGRAKESAYQMVKAAKELKRDFEWTLWNVGIDATGGAGGAGTGVKMKNVHAWISATNNTGSVSTLTAGASATMTETEFNQSWQMIWNQGGKPNTAYLGGSLKRLVSGWGTSTSRVWSGEKKITNTVGVYEGDYGVLETILDRYTNSKAVYLVQEDLFKKAVLQPVKWKPLAARGLGQDFMLYHTFTIESRNASGSGYWYSAS
jgi:hypothetical protein